MNDLADSEVYKNAAIKRMENMDHEVQKVQVLRESEDEEVEIEQETRLEQRKRELAKAKRKRLEEERRLREEEGG